jgi:FeS assembly SUF system protein
MKPDTDNAEGRPPAVEGPIDFVRAVSAKADAVRRSHTEHVKSEVIDALRTLYDPEIPVNIYDLGLIYDVHVSASGMVNIRMTLTSPACPVAESLPIEVENQVRCIDGVHDVNVEVVWDPPWDFSRMSEAARLQLGVM